MLTLSAIEENNAPRATTGMPPDFAMAGRCDVASGASTCMWERDRMSPDSLIPQMGALRKIPKAGNAAIQADSTHAIKACLNHNLADRGHEHFPIGSSVQIAVDKRRAGAFRVIDHSGGNHLAERVNEIAKWPKM